MILNQIIKIETSDKILTDAGKVQIRMNPQLIKIHNCTLTYDYPILTYKKEELIRKLHKVIKKELWFTIQKMEKQSNNLEKTKSICRI